MAGDKPVPRPGEDPVWDITSELVGRLAAAPPDERVRDLLLQVGPKFGHGGVHGVCWALANAAMRTSCTGWRDADPASVMHVHNMHTGEVGVETLSRTADGQGVIAAARYLGAALRGDEHDGWAIFLGIADQPTADAATWSERMAAFLSPVLLAAHSSLSHYVQHHPGGQDKGTCHWTAP
jgi:hypothetical protein